MTNPIKIVALGDSITHASAQQNSYRRDLWNQLVRRGYIVDFVGSENRTKDNTPFLDSSFDPDHEGHWGWRTDEILTGRNGEGNLSNWLNDYTPDIALIHLGSNDLFQGNTTASTIAELRQVIATLRQDNPNVVIFIAQLIPTDNSTWNQRIQTFNAEIPQLVSDEARGDSPVILVDQYSGFDATTDTYDGIHPDDSGEAKMAQRWFDAIANYLDGLDHSTSPPVAPHAPGTAGSTSPIAWNTLSGELFTLTLSPVRLDATLSPIARSIPDQNWKLQTTGDLNGDGQDDILLRHFAAGQNLAFYMNPGGTSIQSEALIGRRVEDPNWSMVGTGDFNNDGHVDIILRNQTADQIVAWYMDGQGNILSESLVGRGFGDNSWSIVASEDFTGDNQTDLLLQHQAAGQILLWEMDGARILSESLVGRQIDSNWLVEGASDVDQSGTVDLILRQPAAGIGLLWSMATPTTIASETVISAMPGGTHQLLF